MHKESAKEEAYSASRQGQEKVKHLTAQHREPDAFVASRLRCQSLYYLNTLHSQQQPNFHNSEVAGLFNMLSFVLNGG